MTSAIFALADDYVGALAELDPAVATAYGIAAGQDRLTDHSPSAQAERADLAAATLASLEGMPETGDDDRVASAVMRERLTTWLGLHEAGEGLRELNALDAAPATTRATFDLTPAGTPAEREAALARLQAVPAALESWREALAEGRARGLLAARRQALATAAQCEAFAGATPGAGWFSGWAARAAGEVPSGQAAAFADAAGRAEAAYAATARWLCEDYAPSATETDAVGEERYARLARAWNGADLDLRETYAWGWEELARITARMERVADRLVPGGTVAAAKDHLDDDDRWAITGTDALLAYLEDLTARTTEALGAEQFDIDPRIRRCEVRLAAEGSAAAPYYMPPSEDLSRPGSTWYATMGRDRFPRWWLVSVWYHEGVPGHHLQVATALLERERLSRFQRTVGWTSGYGEGWALYAERLMDELGGFADEGEEMGFLSAQAMRATRVVVDIGLHLGLTVPAGADLEVGGRVLDAAVAVDLLRRRALLEEDFAVSEVDRYCGLPGQAISYKVGERFWLEARAGAQARHGSAFDLRDWHGRALRLGPMGLDPFAAEMARY